MLQRLEQMSPQVIEDDDLRFIAQRIIERAWPLRHFIANCSEEGEKMFCRLIEGKHSLLSIRLYVILTLIILLAYVYPLGMLKIEVESGLSK